MTAPAQGSLPAIINQSLNAFSSGAGWLVRNGGEIIAPTALGWTGGWITGIGSGLGMFQGAVSAIHHICISKPMNMWCEKYKGFETTQLNPETVDLLTLAEAVAGVAVPILLTYTCGNSVMGKATSYLAEDGTLRWLLTSTHNHEYGLMRGLAVSIAPVVAQKWIAWWRKADQHNKRMH